MYSTNKTIAALTFGLLSATASFGQPSYTSTVIPSPTDFKFTYSLAPVPQPAGDPVPVSGVRQIVYGMRWISDDGTRGVGTGVVGDQSSQLTVCFTYQNGAYTVVPTPSVNCGVNGGSNNGDFVGALQVPGDISTHAFINHGGGYTLLDSLLPQVFSNPDPMVRSTAVTINANGQVLGSTFTTQTSPSPVNGAPTGNFLSYAWLYSNGQIGRIADLGGAYNGATGINDNGDIAGFAAAPGIPAPYHATLNPATGGVIDLGTAGGRYSMASLINNKGQIVGTTSLPSDSPSHPLNHPFFYENGAMTVMIPGASGGAVSLNDAGEAVGGYTLDSDPTTVHLFYYKNGQTTDLQTLVNLADGMVLTEVRQINNQGQILAMARAASDTLNQSPITLLLTPVPVQTGSGQ